MGELLRRKLGEAGEAAALAVRETGVPVRAPTHSVTLGGPDGPIAINPAYLDDASAEAVEEEAPRAPSISREEHRRREAQTAPMPPLEPLRNDMDELFGATPQPVVQGLRGPPMPTALQASQEQQRIMANRAAQSANNANSGALVAPTMTALPAMGPPFILRPGRGTDLAYVIDSWVKSDMWRPGPRLAGPVFRWTANRIIAQEGVILTIAADTRDPDAILGWSITQGTVVFYILVRKELRRKGLARALLAHLPQGPIKHSAKPANGCPVPASWVYDPTYFSKMTRA